MSRQARLGQTTGNLADPSKKDIAQLEATWNAGAVAINAFYDALNTATSTKRQPAQIGFTKKLATNCTRHTRRSAHSIVMLE